MATLTYLDYAASAPLRSSARDAIAAHEACEWSSANPSSLHRFGRRQAQALDSARKDLAAVLGGGFQAPDITFVSGGTEANNAAIVGIAEGVRRKSGDRSVVVWSAIEHDSIAKLTEEMHRRDFEVRIAPPNRLGFIEPECLVDVLDERVALVSIMSVNNETGCIQLIAELAAAAKRVGAYFHTDAVQGYARMPLALDDVDAVSATAHKIGGPIGTGMLALRSSCPFVSQSFGGGQEFGRRSGTQNVTGALAFAAAAQDSFSHLQERFEILQKRSTALYDKLCAPGTGIISTMERLDTERLPGIVSVMAPGCDASDLVLILDEAGYEISSGSACEAASKDSSRVLVSMGISERDALSALRISFDERVSESALDGCAQALLEAVNTYHTSNKKDAKNRG